MMKNATLALGETELNCPGRYSLGAEGWLEISREGETLLVVFERAPSFPRLLIDPVGDLMSFYELSVTRDNTLEISVWRENRSGYRVDSRWVAEGARVKVEPGAVTLKLPFDAIPPATGESGESWQIAVSFGGDKSRVFRWLRF